MSHEGRCPKLHRQVTPGCCLLCLSPVSSHIHHQAPSSTDTSSSHSPDPSKTTYLCFCSQAWHRGSPALALQPGLGLPIRSSQCHVLHLDIHSLEDGASSVTHQSYLALLIPSHLLQP